MRVQKRILVPERLRAMPGSGFSWVDRRFIRNHARALSRDGVLLYFFLAAVSDKHGLSYYGDEATGRILGVTQTAVYAARNELQHRSLVLSALAAVLVLFLLPGIVALRGLGLHGLQVAIGLVVPTLMVVLHARQRNAPR